MDLFYVQVSKQVSLLIGLHFFDVAVEPVLSGHPQGWLSDRLINTGLPLNSGCTKYKSEHSENAILYHS